MTITYRSSSALSFNPIIRRNASLREREEVSSCGRYKDAFSFCGGRKASVVCSYVGSHVNRIHEGDKG